MVRSLGNSAAEIMFRTNFNSFFVSWLHIMRQATFEEDTNKGKACIINQFPLFVSSLPCWNLIYREWSISAIAEFCSFLWFWFSRALITSWAWLCSYQRSDESWKRGCTSALLERPITSRLSHLIKLSLHTAYILFVNLFDNVVNMIVKCLMIHLLMFP